MNKRRKKSARKRLPKHPAVPGPTPAGGDLDADWPRAAPVDEEVTDTVASPDRDVVDHLGAALGVPRAPDEEFHSSTEILEARDRVRREQEE